MDDYLAGNPYLQVFDLPPEARSQHAMGSLANMLSGLGAGISQTGAAGNAPGAAMGSNMMGRSEDALAKQQQFAAQSPAPDLLARANPYLRGRQ